MCDKLCCTTCCKVLIGAIVVIALILAITVSFVHQQTAMGYVVFASRFFDVMIPVLAVGALLKYLLCHKGCSCGDKKS